ncbi:hypothetical protein F4804DRAFT_330212 [Jackrogersella minutella]|nr:hypothetical protein F4804DRAFT_330212 [Jackrogersella minutella]
MNKIPADLTMAWFPHTFQTISSLPDTIWNIISWIAFFFKLASLAFIVPLMSLIIFDFCLWVWRLNRPQIEDPSQPGRISHKATEKRTNLAPPNDTSATTTSALASGASANQRRTMHSGHTHD